MAGMGGRGRDGLMPTLWAWPGQPCQPEAHTAEAQGSLAGHLVVQQTGPTAQGSRSVSEGHSPPN